MSIPSSIREARDTRSGDTGLQFVVGQDETGHWVAVESSGRGGGIFVDRQAALNYAACEAGRRSDAVPVFDRTVGFMEAVRRERLQRTRSAKMIDLIREIIDAKGHLPVAARTIDPNANLYEAGLSPFAAIQVMLALEDACGVEFPKQMLRRRSFSSLNSIAACLERVERKAA